ncbi:hypothetical protein LI410_mgp070 (mitochondrion) [Apium graveolens]|uniref:hypothetical protein n=1 Tax=Apium graveolens TaxID=4045 RepID=UPI001D025063|nr:hypothetical protein LI410_mgp070 [Apium graveolens]QVJ97913.1 hypothetical protein [Apium graveolens]QVJ98037.1 hypothetical protein [Apium graveolens]
MARDTKFPICRSVLVHFQFILSRVWAYLEAASNVIPFSSPACSVFIRTPASPLHLTVATLMEKSLSTGSLRLVSTDVRKNPIVRLNYFSNPEDVEKRVNGTRKIGATSYRNIMALA